MNTLLLEASPDTVPFYSLIGPGLWFCIGLLVVTLVLSVGMPLYNAIKNPAGLLKALIGIVGLVVLFGVAYALSGSEVSQKAATLGTTPGSSKMIGAGLILFYITLIMSTILAAFSLVKDIITD
jgi:hypothetical protein